MQQEEYLYTIYGIEHNMQLLREEDYCSSQGLRETLEDLKNELKELHDNSPLMDMIKEYEKINLNAPEDPEKLKAWIKTKVEEIKAVKFDWFEGQIEYLKR